MKTLFKTKLNCAICFSRKNSKFFLKVGYYNLYLCNKCNLTYLDEISTSPSNFISEAKKPNNKIDYWGYPDYFIKYEKIFVKFFEERFNRVKSFNPPQGRWLDIGSGFGLWLKFISAKGIESLGLEIDQSAFDYSQSRSLNVLNISFENFDSDELFSVITLCDVLEHVESPSEFLEKCYKKLKKGGLLYIQVPDVIGLKIPLNDGLGLPHHIWQFNRKSLDKLARNSKFKEVGFWTGVQGVIKYYERHQFTLHAQLLWKLASLLKKGNRLQCLYIKE